MNSPFPDHIPRNPLYGSGVFRRRIRLQGESGRVTAELEDISHAFRSTVLHNGHCVTAITPELIRAPISTCPGALPRIAELIGTPLDASVSQINQSTNPRTHCTHLYDLTVAAIGFCTQGVRTRVIDIVVPDDDSSGHTRADILYDGRRVLSWDVREWQVQNPGLEGNHLMLGFGKWVTHAYQDEELEAAFWLQKGYMVSQARRYDVDKMGGKPVIVEEGRLGACHTYSAGTIDKATCSHNNSRDFSDCEEKLLKFL